MAASNAGSKAAAKAGEREIIATRVFDAPRELVFKMWTDPEHVAKWWGPKGFTNTIYEMDVRPGGVWRFVMHGPDGRDYQNKIVYVEVVRPERLVYDHVSGPVFRMTATFAERGDKTEVHVRMQFESAELRDKVATEFSAVEGLSQTLGRLEEQLAKLSAEASAAREFVITRLFDARRELVWKAWTDPERLMRWFGPRSCGMPFCKLDARPGGAFHFCHRLPDGRDLWAKGVFREVVAPERLVFILSFVDKEGNPGRHPEFPDWPLDALFVTTVTFAEHESKTTLTVHQVVTSATPSARDTIGVERKMAQQGWAESLDRLAELVGA